MKGRIRLYRCIVIERRCKKNILARRGHQLERSLIEKPAGRWVQREELPVPGHGEDPISRGVPSGTQEHSAPRKLVELPAGVFVHGVDEEGCSIPSHANEGPPGGGAYGLIASRRPERLGSTSIGRHAPDFASAPFRADEEESFGVGEGGGRESSLRRCELSGSPCFDGHEDELLTARRRIRHRDDRLAVGRKFP